MHLADAAGLLVVLCAACGTEIDDRPATFHYISTAILAPSCATAACHTSRSAPEGLAFDTPDAAWRSLIEEDLVEPGQAEDSDLIEALTDDGGDRMPVDSPLPDADIDLIIRWIDSGAERN